MEVKTAVNSELSLPSDLISNGAQPSRLIMPDPALSPARDSAFKDLALSALSSGEVGALISKLSEGELIVALATIGRIYMDIDGTAVKEGEVTFSEKTIAAFRRAQSAGIELCVGPTGKPFAEALPLWKSLPADVAVDVIIEKGAYRLHRLPDGTMEKRYLLASKEEEVAIARFRELFYPDINNLDKQTIGRILEKEFDIVIVPAGSGEHQAVLSFDVLQSGSSREFTTFSNETRKALKVSDQELLTRVLHRFEELYLQSETIGLEGARIIHLGNGNIELAPQKVEKHLAVEADYQARPGVHIAVVGDSLNDRHLLSMAKSRQDVHGCLVLHNPRAEELLDLVHTVVIGEANVADFIDAVVRAKNRFQAT